MLVCDLPEGFCGVESSWLASVRWMKKLLWPNCHPVRQIFRSCSRWLKSSTQTSHLRLLRAFCTKPRLACELWTSLKLAKKARRQRRRLRWNPCKRRSSSCRRRWRLLPREVTCATSWKLHGPARTLAFQVQMTVSSTWCACSTSAWFKAGQGTNSISPVKGGPVSVHLFRVDLVHACWG